MENSIFDIDKPTIIYFGGGDCKTGGGYWGSYAWREKANIINFSYYEPDQSSRNYSYERCGDMIIAYLSSVAPNYNQPIQTMGNSTGGMPAIDVARYLNLTYADRRYAVNRCTFLDFSCSWNYKNGYWNNIKAYLANPADGEQCWIDNYVSAYGHFQNTVLNVGFEKYDHGLAGAWYKNSLTGSDMNQFNGGIIGGAYWSVVGPGKNLQLAYLPDTRTFEFKWYGLANSGYMDFYNEASYPGILPEPVTLIDPTLCAADTNSPLLTCQVSENAVGYQLLLGPDPQHMDPDFPYEVVQKK